MKIIVDTREKSNIFTFSSYDVETVSKTLKTGDYSLENFENKITIDRKETMNELYTNFGFDSKRFKRSLERMSEFDEAYIMCCFPYDLVDLFPHGSHIPQSRWPKLRMTPKYIKKLIFDFTENYNVKFIFSNSNQEAESKTYLILKEYYDKQTSS